METNQNNKKHYCKEFPPKSSVSKGFIWECETCGKRWVLTEWKEGWVLDWFLIKDE